MQKLFWLLLWYVWNTIVVRLDIQHMQHTFKWESKTMFCPYQSETNTTKLWLEQSISVRLNRAEHAKTNNTQKHETEPRNYQWPYPWSAHPSSPNLLSSQNNKSPTLELQNHQSPECKQVHIESESLAWSEALRRRLRCTVLAPVFPNYNNPLWLLNQITQNSLGIDCMYARLWMQTVASTSDVDTQNNKSFRGGLARPWISCFLKFWPLSLDMYEWSGGIHGFQHRVNQGLLHL